LENGNFKNKNNQKLTQIKRKLNNKLVEFRSAGWEFYHYMRQGKKLLNKKILI